MNKYKAEAFNWEDEYVPDFRVPEEGNYNVLVRYTVVKIQEDDENVVKCFLQHNADKCCYLGFFSNTHAQKQTKRLIFP